MTDPSRSLLRMVLARVTVPGLRAAGDVAGLALLVAGAWVWHLGLAVAGLAVLLLVARSDR